MLRPERHGRVHGGRNGVSVCTSSAEPGWSVERRLPARPTSVSEARALVRRVLSDADQADLEDTATLLVSEVVTNAILHAGTPIRVAVRVESGCLRVEVEDGSAHLPVLRDYAATAGTGRGLLLLDQLVDDWGVRRHAEGKTVWFVIGHGDDPQQAAADDPEPRRTEVVDVELLNLPLLLHAAWQEHAEALLRELLLATLDEDAPDGADPIQLHAEATDAMAVLQEHVPRADVRLEPDALMQDATEPRVSVARLPLPVPTASVASFATLDRTIREALDLARSGLSLTPATQPEIQLFRQWLCGQVLTQAEGSPAVPWSVDEPPPPQPRADLEVDLARVRGASHGVVAADDANRIVATSRAAARLLGYDDPEELVGRRILAIIPERYRQAHVAGFTLLQLTGRKPLLGRTVEVPALRRDGVEVPVLMEITAEQAGEGRTLFLARIEPAPGS
jgi:PAS domain S-box-containing protein